MSWRDPGAHRFGSAAFAEANDVARAGMFDRRGRAMLIGFFAGKPVYYSQDGGVLISAGARSGKLTGILGYLACLGIAKENLVFLDVKKEIAPISQNQMRNGRFNYYYNPRGDNGFPAHRINPLDFIRAESPTVVADTKLVMMQMLPLTGAPQSEYFEARGQTYGEAFALTLADLTGVVTLPDLYEVINRVPEGGDQWLGFAYHMANSRHSICRQVEAEIAASRDRSGGGFDGIMGELFKAFAPLSDPLLRESLSPPYDFSMADLVTGDQPTNVYLMCPAEYVQSWAPVLKAIFTAGMIYKSRSPRALKQTWVLDECALLRGFPLVPELFSFGAGIGIRPVAVIQSHNQLKAIGPNAETIIPSSAACQVYFGVRDYESAKRLSDTFGSQTLRYDDPLLQSRALHTKNEAVRSMLNGGDPMKALMDYAHKKRETVHRSVQARSLMTPDEIINAPRDKSFIIADGLGKPLLADRQPYYSTGFMAGRYHPNPYHPPADKVLVSTFWGPQWRRVMTGPVPERFAHYPQYRNGLCSWIEGYGP